MPAELSLGTVQFGLRYGIANSAGQVGPDEAAAILSLARQSGITTLDTAVAYGESEQLLGRLGTTGWKIVTKLPPLPQGSLAASGVADWVRAQVDASLQRLHATRLDALLLHRPADLLEANGNALLAAMQDSKATGRVGRIGVSIYEPQELAALTQLFTPDVVQAPFNVLDRRMQSSGWFARLKAMGTEVHTRSAFLQGLLLMKAADRPPYFERWRELWSRWDRWLAAGGVPAVGACLGFCLANPLIDKVVVGVDSAEHLRQILAASRGFAGGVPGELSSEDPELLNPSRWQRS